MNEQPKVIINCLVYNHEPYLRDCLEGFVMQQTNFPFKAVVHDDASTDNSAAIIREYAEKYPHIIEPIYETENQYSKHDGSLGRIMNAATLGRSPYKAYCEGDDYWIDPLKLQKQVDYMDTHPECWLTCSNVELLTSSGLMPDEIRRSSGWFYCEKSQILPAEQIITKGLHTCSFICRSNIYDHYPEACKKCIVGDIPLQLSALYLGPIYCFAEKMSLYRVGTPGSFGQRRLKESIKEKRKFNLNIIETFESVNQLTNFKYRKAFNQVIYIRLFELAVCTDSLYEKIKVTFQMFKICPFKTFQICYNILIQKFKKRGTASKKSRE